MKGKLLSIAVLFFVGMTGASAQNVHHFKTNSSLVKKIPSLFEASGEQYKFLSKNLGQNKFPKTYYARTLKWDNSNSDWWCSGFYPGTLLYIYEQTKDQETYNEAVRIMKPLAKEQFNKTTHDLGFMMYCSFGNAYRMDPKPEYKEIMINSAKSLASRFVPSVGCIRSWESRKPNEECLVIIDNMMNLELLFWASKVTGDRSYYDIAVTHANTTMKNHFRPDYSSFHLVNYNPSTGGINLKKTVQGFRDTSAWARGQAWGLYGYTVTYRETKDKKYLEQAEHIADYILNHPNLPKDKIPYWDFNAPDIPNALRDASAGAVMASALLELCNYTNAEKGKVYFKAAETMIKSLSSPAYFAKPKANGGYLLEHSVGNLAGNGEVDVPLTYADYYYVEALKRYKEMSEVNK